MMHFKIERGIPVVGGVGSRNRYPWDKMRVGDSFLVPCEGKDEIARIQRSVISTARSRPGNFSVATRRVEGGLRVWRLS